MASQAVSPPATTEGRPLAKFPPNIWVDHFTAFTSFSLANLAFESYAEQIEVLKEKVKAMLMSPTSVPVEKVMVINSLCRLGVSYHFETEIVDQLKHIFEDQALQNFGSHHDHDLYTSALVFRVFRQYGYRMSCEIFNKFKDSDGKFKETLTSDVRGMLSLYEATHLRVHGENILDEALVFTIAHLESVAQESAHPLAKQVLQALEQPLHKGIPRLESRRFISFYQEDESRNETLLEFAKLDFNVLQLLHQQELGEVSRWSKGLDFATKLSYARDRIVECFFWTSGVYYEARYSCARIILTKVTYLISYIDDTFDAYGTFEEIQCFTDAVQRWDASAIDLLPDYMKVLYIALLNLYEEMENEVIEEGRSYSVNYAREAMKELVKGYYVEAKWTNEDYVPRLDEYMDNALISSSCYALAVSSFVGMKIAGKEAFDWIQTKPKCGKACQAIGRLMDDIMGHKVEQERKHVASSVECFMEQHGASEEEAVEELQRRITNAWKDMNEECLRPTAVSMDVLVRVLNLTRAMDVVYKFDDGYTNSERDLKHYITLLFIDPISIAE